MKLHFEQEKSAKLEHKLTTFMALYNQKLEELEAYKMKVHEMHDTIQALHEGLENQDSILEDSRCINQAYQERFEEIQFKIELHLEHDMKSTDLSPRESQSPAIFVEPKHCSSTDSNYKVTSVKLRSVSESEPESKKGSPTYTRNYGDRILLRSPPQTDRGEESDPESRTKSRSVQSPTLPEPSDEDVFSLYRETRGRMRGNQNVSTPQLEWIPKYTLRELKKRIESAEKHFKIANESLTNFLKPIENPLSNQSIFDESDIQLESNNPYCLLNTDFQSKAVEKGGQHAVAPRKYLELQHQSDDLSEFSFVDISVDPPLTPRSASAKSLAQKHRPCDTSPLRNSTVTVTPVPRYTKKRLVRQAVCATPSVRADVWVNEAVSSGKRILGRQRRISRVQSPSPLVSRSSSCDWDSVEDADMVMKGYLKTTFAASTREAMNRSDMLKQSRSLRSRLTRA